jgi:hypothetical protein
MSFARPRIRLCALATNGQPSTMPQATIGADIDQPLNISFHLAAKLAFYLIVPIDDLAQPRDL